MILFCDTSAVVKLYINELHSDQIIGHVKQVSLVAACRISWAETVAAMARQVREKPHDTAVIALARLQFETQWNNFAIIEVTQPLVELAGNYADTFALRGYDSVQLAAARSLQESTTETMLFACFDERLCKAAKILGMQVL